jgi:hypothetical protein
MNAEVHGSQDLLQLPGSDRFDRVDAKDPHNLHGPFFPACGKTSSVHNEAARSSRTQAKGCGETGLNFFKPHICSESNPE